MYLEHFGLNDQPFRITPHTDFFFDGADRGTTLEALVYAVQHDEGIVKVSGEVGSGKTMLCRVLLERLPEQVETVYLANPSLTRDELLHSIADELQIKFSNDGTRVAMRELFEHLIGLYGQGKRVVILIDEAHAMPEETLEQVRLLSNLESSRHKLLQMVLFGQPELDAALAKPSMRQLKDRITHSFRMRPLAEDEISTYIAFRMRAAGYRGPDVFTPKAVALIGKASSGLSRRINILADKSLLKAFADDKHAVTEQEARAAIRDSEFAAPSARPRWWPLALGAAMLLLGLAIGFGLHWYYQRGDAAPAAPTPTAAPAAGQGNAPATVPAAPAQPPAAAAADAKGAPAPTAEAAPAVPPAAPPDAPKVAEPDPAPKPATPLLAPEQSSRIGAYAVGPNRLARERIAATQERLSAEPDASYAIELFTTDNSDPARLERFLIRARALVSLEEVYVIPIAVAHRYRIRVVYGAYSDRDAAGAAQAAMPTKYRQAFPLELRTYGELRRAI